MEVQSVPRLVGELIKVVSVHPVFPRVVLNYSHATNSPANDQDHT